MRLRSRFAEAEAFKSSPPSPLAGHNMRALHNRHAHGPFNASASCEGMLRAELALARKRASGARLEAQTCALLCRKQLTRCEHLEPLVSGTAASATAAAARAAAALEANPSLRVATTIEQGERRFALRSLGAAARATADDMARCQAQLALSADGLREAIETMRHW